MFTFCYLFYVSYRFMYAPVSCINLLSVGQATELNLYLTENTVSTLQTPALNPI